MNLIDRSKWKQLFDNIEETLIDVATLPRDGMPDAVNVRKTNQAKFAKATSGILARVFDPAMTNEEFWSEIVAKPLWTARGPAHGKMIETTSEYMSDFGGAWLKDGPERTAMLADQNYLERGQRRQVIEAALKDAHRWLGLHPGKTLIDKFIPQAERGFDEVSLRAIFNRLEATLGWGEVTTFHVMMDLGLPVVKPDRVVTLVAVRLGLIRQYDKVAIVRGTKQSSTERLPSTLPQGQITVQSLSGDMDFVWTLQGNMREIARETGRSVRDLDWLLVKLGATIDPDAGIVRSVCERAQPKCHVCLANSICAFGKFNRKEAKRQALALAA